MTTHPIASSADELEEFCASMRKAFGPVNAMSDDKIISMYSDYLQIWNDATAFAIASHTAQDKAVGGYSAEQISHAWYETGQDVRGGSFQSFLDALAASPQLPVAQMSCESYFTDEEGDGVALNHPLYGPGVFFTDDCRRAASHPSNAEKS